MIIEVWPSKGGRVAEQVEKVNPDPVARDEEGKPYAVRYDVRNALTIWGRRSPYG